MASTRNTILVLLFAFLFVSAILADGATKKATETKAGAAKPAEPVKAAGGAKVEEAAKPVDTKPPVVNKPVDTKPAETKPVETKPAETKPVEAAKPVETKPAAEKPVEAKQPPVEPKKEEKPVEVKTEAKPAETKPVETKPVEAAKPVETKPAAEKPKVQTKVEETKPVEPKKTEAKKEQKTETKPKASSTPKTDASTGNALDDIQKQAVEYLQKAQTLAEPWIAEARVHYAKYGQIAHENAERIVDKYVSAHNAKFLKTNLFNLYGVLALTLSFFILAFVSSKIDWVFSLNPVRAFLSAFGLGVFATLYGFTRLVKDPAALIQKNSPEALDSLQIVALGWFATLVALNFVALLRGGVRNFLQFLTSGLLFIEYFELKHHIEAHTGALPAYSLILLAFGVLTYLSFAQLEAILHPEVVYNVDYQVKSAQASAIAKEKKDKNKVKKN